MALQPTTFSDLRKRLIEIEEERKDIEVRLRALNQESSAIQTLLRQTNDDSPKKTRADHIREALQAIDKGSPKAVADEMTKHGWNWNGATPSSVVGVELNRLSAIEGSHVEWVERGIYRYKD